MYKILRRGSGRVFALSVIVLFLLLCLYYVSQNQTTTSGVSSGLLNEVIAGGSGSNSGVGGTGGNSEKVNSALVSSSQPDYNEYPDVQVTEATCPLVVPRNADIDAQREFEKFDFQVRIIENVQ